MGLEISPSVEESNRGQYTFPDLHKAVITNAPKKVRRLLHNNIDINQRDQNGFTPLHLAVNLKKLNMVKFLVKECGADINAKTQSGLTPLHLSSLGHGKLEILRHLILSGCDINSTDSNGCTALHIAVKTKVSQCVIVLLGEGCNHELTDKKGRTPKDIAIEYKNLELINIINEHDERLSSKSNGQTAPSRPVFIRQRHDFHARLCRRSSSLVSAVLTLKPILENERAISSDSDGDDSESDDSESYNSYPDLTDTGSIDSVFSETSKDLSIESLWNNNNKGYSEFSKKQPGVMNGLSLWNSGSNGNSLLAKAYRSRLPNGFPNKGLPEKTPFNIPKIAIHRTVSQDSGKSRRMLLRRFSLIDDDLISPRSDNYDIIETDEEEAIASSSTGNLNDDGLIRSKKFSIDLFDRVSSLYCLEVDEDKNGTSPRIRKVASSSFSLGKNSFEKGDDSECDTDILSLLRGNGAEIDHDFGSDDLS